MDIRMPKYKLLMEVFYADFVKCGLQKSKIVGIILQPKDMPPVYHLDNGITLDEDNIYSNKQDAKTSLNKIFDSFKENLENENG